MSLLGSKKRNLIALSILAILLFIGFNKIDSSNEIETATQIKRITILQTIQHPALDRTCQGIVESLLANKELKGQLRIEVQCAQGSAVLASQMAQKFIGEAPSVAVGIGSMASQSLVAADGKRTQPILFSSVTDPVAAKLVTDLKRPTGLVTGVSNYVAPSLQFAAFKKVMPNLKRLGVIYNPGEANSARLVEQMKQEARGIELIFAAASTTSEVPGSALKLIGQVDALFINNDNTALAAIDSVIQVASMHKIPLFCSDVDTTERGVLASLGPDQYQIGQQSARMIEAILQGISPSALPVEFPVEPRLYINGAIAERLGLTLDPALTPSLIKKAS